MLGMTYVALRWWDRLLCIRRGFLVRPVTFIVRFVIFLFSDHEGGGLVLIETETTIVSIISCRIAISDGHDEKPVAGQTPHGGGRWNSSKQRHVWIRQVSLRRRRVVSCRSPKKRRWWRPEVAWLTWRRWMWMLVVHLRGERW